MKKGLNSWAFTSRVCSVPAVKLEQSRSDAALRLADEGLFRGCYNGKAKPSGISVLKTGCWRINLEPFVIDCLYRPSVQSPSPPGRLNSEALVFTVHVQSPIGFFREDTQLFSIQTSFNS